jgi:hypothetical protein
MSKPGDSEGGRPDKMVTTITITRSVHKAVRQESISQGVTASYLYEEAVKRLLGLSE